MLDLHCMIKLIIVGSPPLLVKLKEEDILKLYFSVLEHAASSVLMHK